MSRGGKRDGAGRPKGEPSKYMRIPESLVPTVGRMVQNHRRRKKLSKSKNKESVRMEMQIYMEDGDVLFDTTLGMFGYEKGCGTGNPPGTQRTTEVMEQEDCLLENEDMSEETKGRLNRLEEYIQLELQQILKLAKKDIKAVDDDTLTNTFANFKDLKINMN